MDWKECFKKGIVKEVKEDTNLIKSLKDTAKIKIKSAEALPDDLFIGKITLLYDALRELLESLALENGYKIYNHECYTAFLKEVLELSDKANRFDKLRKIRNAINYYGRKVSKEEAEDIIKNMFNLINEIKSMLKED